jgi:hypothetical protein
LDRKNGTDRREASDGCAYFVVASISCWIARCGNELAKRLLLAGAVLRRLLLPQRALERLDFGVLARRRLGVCVRDQKHDDDDARSAYGTS